MIGGAADEFGFLVSKISLLRKRLWGKVVRNEIKFRDPGMTQGG